MKIPILYYDLNISEQSQVVLSKPPGYVRLCSCAWNVCPKAQSCVKNQKLLNMLICFYSNLKNPKFILICLIINYLLIKPFCVSVVPS